MFNKFFVFEGVDGSGKTTCINLTADLLREIGFKVVVVREPGGDPLSEHFRSLLLDGFPNTDQLPNDTTRALMFNASRSEQVTNTIIPKLKEGYVVLADRFVDTTLVYQGYCGNNQNPKEEIKKLIKLHDLVIGINPKTTFFIDCPPDISFKRTMERGELNILDSALVEGARKRYEGYKEVMELRRGRTNYITVCNSNSSAFNTSVKIAALIEGCLDEGVVACGISNVVQFLKELEFVHNSGVTSSSLVDRLRSTDQQARLLENVFYNYDDTPNLESFEELRAIGYDVVKAKTCPIGLLPKGLNHIQLSVGRVYF